MENAASAVLSSDFQLGWVGSALQEKMASSDTTIIFVLALVMVFLILAAQYESSLPLSVLTAVPFGVFGALVATWGRRLSTTSIFQVALVTLVGLAAKNAILIVEFAVGPGAPGAAAVQRLYMLQNCVSGPS